MIKNKTEKILYVLLICSFVFVLLAVFSAGEETGRFVEIKAGKERFDVEEMARISAEFENTGSIPVLAKFECELYRDEKLVDFFESREVRVAVGGKRTLKAYFRPGTTGSYEAKGHFVYSGKTTDIRTAEFTVGSEKEGKENIVPLGAGALAIVILLISLAVFYFSRGSDQGQTKISQFGSGLG